MDHAPTGDAFAPGLLARLPAPRRVALVRVSRLGDFICATPAFRALRAALPEAEITLIGLPFARELVARSRQLDRFAPFPGFPGMAEQFFDARRAAAFLRRMQRERFDLAVQMHGSGVYSNPFTLLLGARATAGFVRPGDPSGRLDAALPLPDELPEIERLLALVTFLGAPAHGATPEYPLWPADHAAAERLLARLTRPLIRLHPAARHSWSDSAALSWCWAAGRRDRWRKQWRRKSVLRAGTWPGGRVSGRWARSWHGWPCW